MNIPAEIRRVQAELQRRGRYTGPIDGKAGVGTWTGISEVLFGTANPAPSPADPPAVDRVDDRSEKAIATLHDRVRPFARALVHAAAAQGIGIVVTSALRTYAEQDALFAKGGVTKARGGYSNHNFGTAFDVTIFDGKKPVYESPRYKAIGSLGLALGLQWGGTWKSFVDEPHFQLRPPWAREMTESQMLAEFRRRKSAGLDAFA